MNAPLDSFETRLLAELREHVSERGNVEGANDEPRRRFAGARFSVVAAASAVIVVAVLLAPGLGSSPAYSVGEGNAGEIYVEINRPEDADGLEQALEAYGITADITYLPQLQICEPGRYTVVDRKLAGLMTSVGENSISVTLPPGAIRDGETFVLVWSVMPLTAEKLGPIGGDVSGFSTTVEFDVATGPVAPCQPVELES